MKNIMNHLPFSSFRVSGVLVALLASSIVAEINYKEAFPGLTFQRPVYFGAFPGKAKTYVVLEQHKGNVLLVSQKGTAWVKDTLYHLEVHDENEMGLLGIAFHPDFVNNRRYFIAYDPDTFPALTFFNIVEERTVNATLLKDSGNKGVEILKMFDKYRNHNGGTLLFGPNDGYLYIGTGDGGLYNDPDGNSQNKDVLLGKMLRIDINKKERITIDGKDSLVNYGIPPSNPFAVSGGRKEIYAFGLRNPWKFTIDPLTNDMWAGDVGQGTFEEVDIITSGGNYGWKVMEGPKEVFGNGNSSMIPPVFSYGRTEGISVTGGEVYRAVPGSKFYGSYFIGDFNKRALWTLKKNGTGPATVTVENPMPANPSSFGLDETGRIYFCGHNDGKIYLLDSPDLGPRTVNIQGEAGLSSRAYRQVFHATAGSSLDPRIFTTSQNVELYSIQGGSVATLKRGNPQLPQHVGIGVYLIRKAAYAGDPDLLVVH